MVLAERLETHGRNQYPIGFTVTDPVGKRRPTSAAVGAASST
jgi:hypothetical protein